MTKQHNPSKNYRTFVLILLTLVYSFNFIDRQIVGILAPFIQKDLDLTNTQMGLLTGLLFAALYTVVAIPIAWLADRYNRVIFSRSHWPHGADLQLYLVWLVTSCKLASLGWVLV